MTERFEDRRVYWVWLGMVLGAGNPVIWQLCRGYEHIWQFAEELRDGRLDSKLTEAQRAKRSMPFSEAAELISGCHDEGISVLSFRSEGFPERLRRIPDPPAVLFVRGNADVIARDKPSVLFVGTRNPTAYSVRTAERLAKELSDAGVTVLSGLEDGIDAVACEAAAENGNAAAVLGRGIMSGHYSTEQAGKIAAKGALIAEYTSSEEYGRVPFDKRNRLLCGLADAVVFIECRADSAGLNNAFHAQRIGRPVLAVPPADIYDSRFFGQRDLLKAGAKAVYSPDDILAAIGRHDLQSGGEREALAEIGGRKHSGRAKNRSREQKKVKEELTNTEKEQKNVNEGLHNSEMSATIDMSGFSEEQKMLWEIFTERSGEPLHLNKLAELTGCGIAELVDDLTFLRLEGLITELSGRRYIKR